jgi:hypothetical protein
MLALLLAILPVTAVSAQNIPQPAFHSWYDGWGTHTVWGIGKIRGASTNVWILCADQRVPVVAVHDTHDAAHTDEPGPDAKHTASALRQSNQQLLQAFAQANAHCAFDLVGPDGP